MYGKKILLSGFLAASLSSSVFAVTTAPDGWYLDGAAGYSSLSNKSYPGSSSSSGVGYNADVGYKFMPFFAMELGYTQYASTTIKDQNGTKAGKDRHTSYGITGKGIVPIMSSGFELFGKLGIQRSTSKVTIDDSTAAANIGLSGNNHSNTGLYLGAGAEYFVMPELGIFVQWARAQNNSNTGNLDLYSAGLSLIFS